ncbi:MAG: tRNA (N(6)-L-threonylcarbamoyladenosine(37)-C(2))-methylthiotransferase [Candidatus Micrarchaeota archaeon]
MVKVYIETYGCTLNQAESDIMHALLSEQHEIVANESQCDVLILNTCTVKGPTENRIFERIKSLVSNGKKIVIAGCLTVNEKKIRKYAPKAPIVKTHAISQISDAVNSAFDGVGNIGKVYGAVFTRIPTTIPKLATSPIARIPVNDGCTSNCFICQTKLARPYLRSYSQKTIVKWINEAVSQGAKEIQLTSMDLGTYGLDLKTDLVSLLDNIIKDDSSTHKDTKFMIRLGMINPNHLKHMLPDIIRILKHPKFYKFIHIPVQTGSEKVCNDMNRDHTVKYFVDIVNSLRREIDGISIATDIIVGYPTETDGDFEQTKKLLETIRPEVVNISKFSPRPGTKAKELKQLHNDIIKSRTLELVAFVRKMSVQICSRSIGKTYQVLITEKQGDFTGRNINYMQVVVKDFKGQLGDLINVKIIDAGHGFLFGKSEI